MKFAGIVRYPVLSLRVFSGCDNLAFVDSAYPEMAWFAQDPGQGVAGYASGSHNGADLKRPACGGDFRYGLIRDFKLNTDAERDLASPGRRLLQTEE